MEFRTDAVFVALATPLALVEDAERRQAFERYVEAARPSLERAVFDLLSELVSGVEAQVSEHYRLRLAYRPGALTLDIDRKAPARDAEAPAGAETWTDWTAADGETEKVTIRIPAELKDLITHAAGSSGVSANSWFIRALGRALRGMEEGEDPRPPRPPQPPGWGPPSPPARHSGEPPAHGKRLQGWIGGE